MRRAVERSSAPFQARKAPPPLLSPTSPADSSVITAGGTGGTDVLRERVPEQATRPETLLQSVARDHGPARGSDSGLWMCEPGSAVSAGAVRLTTICATQGREDWGWPNFIPRSSALYRETPEAQYRGRTKGAYRLDRIPRSVSRQYSPNKNGPRDVAPRRSSAIPGVPRACSGMIWEPVPLGDAPNLWKAGRHLLSSSNGCNSSACVARIGQVITIRPVIPA
ncbi:uncharacterized protein CC84DRAFT_1177210 [Paraphaeosphaeria sporulosa]|uniref:Uncharacterized protein n=1 Tax=Paraphaeosphaeria sporulosa TaxID=1460663 RepID=A0A177CD40_9PLEO|nr:uncharacterized protein CC84DRAFT_1177210 [Paraphaeosphaeria sporulosa]OAG05111.1 hypothetical protein CC84DRAFT_1177210 [Paraphaeosphaeria sporulosa]